MSQAGSERRREVAEIMATLLAENPNLPDIKAQLATMATTIQRHIYHGITGSEEEYLQVYGLSYHEEEHFNYINQLLHARTNEVLDRIDLGEVRVRSTLPQPPPPPPQTPAEIVREVEEVLRNVDLPLSLFKRRDHYWSQDNAKTVQVREYIKELHEKDRKWKGELKRKRQEILNSQNESYHRTIEESARQEKKAKEEEKLRMKRKIETLRSMGEVRKKTIDDGLDYIKKHGRPLYKKMQEEYHAQVELPTLEEKKRKLSEVRELRRSVDLVEIQQHRQKHDRLREEHEGVRITNEPVKVSFKGRHHQSLAASSVREAEQEGRVKSLLERREEYAQMVSDNFRPDPNPDKVMEIQNRIEQMNKRFTRARKPVKRSEEEEEEDEEEEEEEEEPEPEAADDDEDEEEEEEEDFRLPKDDQYEPTQNERYKMGIRFLEEAKRKRRMQEEKKSERGESRSEAESKPRESVRRKARSARGKTPQAQSGVNSSLNTLPVATESGGKVQYRNYLHEMSKNPSKTIDFLDTSQIRTEVTNDLRLKGGARVEELENKLRTVSQKTQQEEELLKYRKVKRGEAIDKKQELDKAMIDTIKARLAMMNH